MTYDGVMKIVDAITCRPADIPLTLGEKGRGRWLERVELSRRPDQCPSSADDVGYFRFGSDDRPHVVLTTPVRGQTGTLLVCRTKWTYRRGGAGSTRIVAGSATMLTSGKWAMGTAGRVGSGVDSLWHCQGNCVFQLGLCGGGLWWVFVMRGGRVRRMTTSDVAQVVASDEDADLAELVRLHVGQFPEEIQDAVRVADMLDDATEEPPPEGFHHYLPPGVDIDAVCERLDLTASEAVKHGSPVGGVEAGVIVPGKHPLVYVTLGPGGGKRYDYSWSFSGLSILARREDRNTTTILAVPTTPKWCAAASATKDGEKYETQLVDASCVKYCNHQSGEVYAQEWSR